MQWPEDLFGTGAGRKTKIIVTIMSKHIFELLIIYERAKKELARIEDKNRSWKSDQIKKNAIWDDIAMQINSTDGQEYEFWSLVMDLYHKKYSSKP